MKKKRATASGAKHKKSAGPSSQLPVINAQAAGIDVRRGSAEARAERIIADELQRLGWSSADLSLRRKTDPNKLHIAQRLRARKPSFP